MPLFRRRKAEPSPPAPAPEWPARPEVVDAMPATQPAASPSAPTAAEPGSSARDAEPASVPLPPIARPTGATLSPADPAPAAADAPGATPSAASLFASPGRWHLASADTRVPARASTTRAAPRENGHGRWHQV